MKITRSMIKENVAFHCNTEEKANELLKKLDELGYKWANDKSYLDNNGYCQFYMGSCYYPYKGTVSSARYFEDHGYDIVEYELDVIELDTDEKINMSLMHMLVKAMNKDISNYRIEPLKKDDSGVYLANYIYFLNNKSICDSDIDNMMKNYDEMQTSLAQYIEKENLDASEDYKKIMDAFPLLEQAEYFEYYDEAKLVDLETYVLKEANNILKGTTTKTNEPVLSHSDLRKSYIAITNGLVTIGTNKIVETCDNYIKDIKDKNMNVNDLDFEELFDLKKNEVCELNNLTSPKLFKFIVNKRKYLCEHKQKEMPMVTLHLCKHYNINLGTLQYDTTEEDYIFIDTNNNNVPSGNVDLLVKTMYGKQRVLRVLSMTLPEPEAVKFVEYKNINYGSLKKVYGYFTTSLSSIIDNLKW